MVRAAIVLEASYMDSLLTVQEVAKTLGVSTRGVWKWAGCGKLPAPVRLGRAVRWRQTDIDEFIAARCIVADASPRQEKAGAR